MMEEYILDSNILIYYTKRDPKVISLLKGLRREYFFISVITRIEVLMGAKTDQETKGLDQILRTFAPLDLGTKIALEAVRLEQKHHKKLKFKDLLIAATAMVEGLTLVTADKDFKKIPDLELKLVRL